MTEHSKPVKCGYKEILGWYNPLKHESEIKIDSVKAWIGKGAKPSERVAKILFQKSKDDFFKKYLVTKTIERKIKNPDKYSK